MQLIGRENNQKLYMQLYEILKKKIESNEWTVGSLIPPEEDLCQMFNISRSTVRTAVLELVGQGYLRRQQGKGTFVSKNTGSDGLSMFTTFNELFFEEGIKYTTHVLARTVMMPIDDLDIKLDITKDKHLIYIKRLHSIKDEPVLFQETFVPYHICPLLLEEEIDGHPLFELFEKKYGIKITKAKTYMDITYLNSDEARLLGAMEGTIAILMNQYFYSNETLIMYTRSIKRTDRFPLLMEFERKGI
jgi:GntR family transcriptional regulator